MENKRNYAKKIVSLYANGKVTTEIEQQFAEWLTAGGFSEEKDEALLELWEEYSKNRVESEDTYINLVRLREILNIEEESSASSLTLQQRAHLLMKDVAYERFKETLINESGPSQVRKATSWYKIITRSAAVLLPLILIASFFILKMSTIQLPGEEYAHTITAGSNIRHIVLPDSSVVWLNESSELFFDDDFTEKRHLRLSGEAYFDVRKNSGNPFVVSTASLVVEVLGTKFNVKDDGEKSAEVVLTSGSVDVTTNNGESRILKPDETLVFDYATSDISLERFKPEEDLLWINNALSFNDNSLNDILEIVGSYYGMPITIEPGVNAQNRLTLNLPIDLDFNQIMEVLTLVNPGMDYRRQGDTTVIFMK